ncbi:hypothetical protein U0070_013684 [Myodes glareolus]|uniref:Protein kinase domain-containing protein n=1 Tax=Myodes glareolus TaxID=447135 RepID=A0AAW0GTF8_MYOGA
MLYQSPSLDNTNHNAKLMQPNLVMAPTEPPTCHYFLKSIGSEPDNATSTLPANYQSHGYDKLVKKKDSKNPSISASTAASKKANLNPQVPTFGLTKKEVHPISQQVVPTVEYLHKRTISHWDIKFKNIL